LFFYCQKIDSLKRHNLPQQAGVIREISKHIANRTVKRHNNKILTTANSGVLTANSLTGTLSADMLIFSSNGSHYIWHSTTSIRIGILP
jgi:hypothetical protein